MSSILRRIRKSSLTSSSPKHEKLLEDPGPGEVDPVLEGIHFKVKFLGSCPVTSDSGEEVTANAIKCILATAKRLDKKLPRVEVTVSLAGVSVVEQEAMQCLLDLPIDSISYCSADPTYDHVFSLLCTREDGFTCYAFLTPKRKMAQAATLTIAQAFNLAYELWRVEKPPARKTDTSLKTSPASVVVTQAVVEPIPSHSVSPTIPPPPNSLVTPTVSSVSPSNGSMKTQNLLLDFRNVSLSETEKKRDIWEEDKEEGEEGRHRGVSESSASWVQFGGEEDEEETAGGGGQRSRFEMNRSALPILSKLPSSSVSMTLSAFCSSPSSGWGSPGSPPPHTPFKGSQLTASQLASPVGSPPPLGAQTPAGSPLQSGSSYTGSPTLTSLAHMAQEQTLLDWGASVQVSSPPRRSSYSNNTCQGPTS